MSLEAGRVLADWDTQIVLAWRRNKLDIERWIPDLQERDDQDSLGSLLEAKNKLATLLVKEEKYWK